MKDYTRIAVAIAVAALVMVVSDIDISFIGHGLGSTAKFLLLGGVIWYIVSRSGGCCTMKARPPEAPTEV